MSDTLKYKKYSDRFSHYNLGSGPDDKDAPYLNIDFLPEAPMEDFVELSSGKFYLNFDLTKDIPAADNSLEGIYQSHFLEHVNYMDGIFVLQECFRALKPGGKMRVIVPDLEFWIDAYKTKKMHFFETYMKMDGFKEKAHLMRTSGSLFNSAMHDHGHKATYDFETLFWLLSSLGFENVRRTSYADGNYDLHQNDKLRSDDPLRAVESLCVECVKPKS